ENSLRSSVPPSQFVPAHEAQLVNFDRLEPTADGNAGVTYETNHGLKVIQRIRPDAEGFNTYTGSYSYFDSEGTPVVVSYVADRDGYYAIVPIPPNIPPHAAEQIRRGQQEHEKARLLFAKLR
ncbi:Insect cuticle protein, partial [Trinorchestia longiramus]